MQLPGWGSGQCGGEGRERGVQGKGPWRKGLGWFLEKHRGGDAQLGEACEGSGVGTLNR